MFCCQFVAFVSVHLLSIGGVMACVVKRESLKNRCSLGTFSSWQNSSLSDFRLSSM